MADVSITPGPWQQARVLTASALTPRVKRIVLALPQPFAYAPGQHVQVRLTAPDGYQAQRSYSIASAPESADGLELAIERLDDGEVSPYFHNVVEPGDTFEVRGPIGGHFIWTAARGTPLLAIGGGSGVVPLMSMIRHWAATAARVPAALIVSARQYDEVLYRDELFALDAAGDGFGLHVAVTRGVALRTGDVARRMDVAFVADVVARHGLGAAEVFVCGSNAFVEAAVAAVLATGLAPERIRTERFGG
jgi:ferredoxin-NADP reductase